MMTDDTGKQERFAQEDRAVEALLADSLVEIDLTDPPSRADLAVPEGRTYVPLQREDNAPFTVRVTFSDGTVLESTARVLSVETDGDGPPTGLTVRNDGLTFDELQSTLLEDETTFGLDKASVASFLRAAPHAEERGTDVRRSIRASAVQEPEWLEVSPRMHHEGTDHMINYRLGWPAS